MIKYRPLQDKEKAMKKRKKSASILAGIIICGLLAFKSLINAGLLIISCLPASGRSAASIGIIGGADGPTAVFLSSPMKFLFLPPVLELFGLVFILFLLIRCRRNCGKEKAVNPDPQ